MILKKITLLLVMSLFLGSVYAQNKKKMEANKQTVDAFFVALETENFENLRNIFTADAKQLNPYVPEGFPKEYVGSEGIYKQYSGLPKLFSDMRFPRKIMATEDPNVVFVTFRGKIDIRVGGTYENDYIGIFKLRDGKIYEYTEYFNPIVMAKAFGIPLGSQKIETGMNWEVKQEIKSVVTSIFKGTDARDWKKVRQSFATNVLLDYTSMAGGEPAELTPEQITGAWSGILPGFEFTQHTISNFEVEINGDEATVFHYGTATHYLENESGDNLWTAVGTYDHHLVKTDDGWKVDQMRFNFKYMTGNKELPGLAQKALAKN